MNVTRKLGRLVSIVLLALTALLSKSALRADQSSKSDSHYIGDQTNSAASDSIVKRFRNVEADGGVFLGAFVPSNSGRLKGPRGLLFDHPGHLLVVHQNQDLEPLSGAVLRYNDNTGTFQKEIVDLVPRCRPKRAVCVPRYDPASCSLPM